MAAWTRHHAPFVIVCVLASVLARPAEAWFLRSAVPGNRLIMNLDLSTTPFQTLGYGLQSWSSLAQGALVRWNEVGIGFGQDHGFFATNVPTVVGDPCNPDGVNEVRFAATVCGLAWGSGVLGVTTTWIINGKRVEADVLFNSLKSWNAYPGPLRFAGTGEVIHDFFRVALHEFGHAAGLTHPDEFGQTVTALMNSNVSDVDNLQPDDIAGAHVINWPPGPLSVSVNQPSFSSGQTLVASAGVNNPGSAATVDFYLGALLPDGDTLVFLTNGGSGTAVGRASDAASFQPVAASISLATPFASTVPNVFTYSWTGSEPRGSYVFLFAAVRTGALADGSIDPGDVLALSVASFAFTP